MSIVDAHTFEGERFLLLPFASYTFINRFLDQITAVLVSEIQRCNTTEHCYLCNADTACTHPSQKFKHDQVYHTKLASLMAKTYAEGLNISQWAKSTGKGKQKGRGKGKKGKKNKHTKGQGTDTKHSGGSSEEKDQVGNTAKEADNSVEGTAKTTEPDPSFEYLNTPAVRTLPPPLRLTPHPPPNTNPQT